MLTASNLKANLLQVLRVLELNGGAYIDYSHHGRAYRLHIEDLRQSVKHTRRKPESLTDQVESKRCGTCGKLELNGICVNVSCASQAA